MSRAPRRAPRRRPSRAALLGWSAFLWAPVLLVGGVLVSVTAAAQVAVDDYADGRTDRAASTFSDIDGWARMERWKAPFGQGTAMLADGRSPRLSLFELNRALARVPDEERCQVQTNRAVALTLVADDLRDDAAEHAAWALELSRLRGLGEPAPEDAPWGDRTLNDVVAEGIELAEQSSERYEDAIAARLDPTCEGQQSQEEQEEAQQDAEELRERQGEADNLADTMDPEQPQPDDGEGQGEGGDQSEQDQEQQRQDELRQRNEDAQREDDQQGGSGGGTDRPW